MTALAQQLQNAVQNRIGSAPGQPRDAIVDGAGSLWVNKSNASGKAFLAGNFGRARLSLFQNENRQNESQPHWFSYLAQPIPKEKRGTDYRPPSIPWSGFWEREVNGKTILSTTLTSPTETSTGVALEFILFSDGTNSQPMFIGRFRSIPKRPAGETPAAEQTSESPPASDDPPAEAPQDDTIPF